MLTNASPWLCWWCQHCGLSPMDGKLKINVVFKVIKFCHYLLSIIHFQSNIIPQSFTKNIWNVHCAMGTFLEIVLIKEAGHLISFMYAFLNIYSAILGTYTYIYVCCPVSILWRRDIILQANPSQSCARGSNFNPRGHKRDQTFRRMFAK